MIDFYYRSIPNGWKVSIMPEETGLSHTLKPVNVGVGDQFKLEFLPISPNARMPVMIVDHDTLDGPLPVFESGAILVYLADKAGGFMKKDPAGRYETLQWLMFQMSAVGPMFGQVGFFHKFAGKEYEDKRPRDRYVAEARRLLGVLDRRLADRPWLTGEDYTIADIATFPWVNNLIGFYGAAELVTFSEFTHVAGALKAFLARPAVVRGLDIPKRG